jgi:hypothetical protein
MEYNVEVQGILVWIVWTRNRAEAIAELMAWRRMEKIKGQYMRIRLRVRRRLGKP